MFRIKFSRELILKLLYQIDIQDLDDDYTAKDLLEDNQFFIKGLTKVERDFILKIVQKVLDEKGLIDQLISNNLVGWKLDRLMIVDRTLLRMGVAESFFNSPKAVIIDDIIRIAKKYGGNDSYKIINAVLDKVLE
jgi:transcription antitermination protein NusB